MQEDFQEQAAPSEVRRMPDCIETDRLIIRRFRLSSCTNDGRSCLPDIRKYNSYDEHVAADLFDPELFLEDGDTRAIFEITQNPDFLFTQFTHHSQGSKGPDFPSFAGVRNFMWTMCREWADPNPTGYGYAIVLKPKEEGDKAVLCGHVRVYDIDYDAGTAKRAAFVGVEYQRYGIAKEALMELTRAAFSDLKLQKINIQVDPENKPSVMNIQNSFGISVPEEEIYVAVAGFDEPQRRHIYGLESRYFLFEVYPRYLQKLHEKSQEQVVAAAEEEGHISDDVPSRDYLENTLYYFIKSKKERPKISPDQNSQDIGNPEHGL